MIRKDIKKEMNAISFIAVEMDDTTDVTQKAQIFCAMWHSVMPVKGRRHFWPLMM